MKNRTKTMLVGGVLASLLSLQYLEERQKEDTRSPSAHAPTPFPKKSVTHTHGHSISKRKDLEHKLLDENDSFSLIDNIPTFAEAEQDREYTNCVGNIGAYFNAIGELAPVSAEGFCSYVSAYPEGFGDLQERSCIWDVTQYLREERERNPSLPIPASVIRKTCRYRTDIDEDALVLARDISTYHTNGKAEFTAEDGTQYTVESFEDQNNFLDNSDFLDITVVGSDGSQFSCFVDEEGLSVAVDNGNGWVPLEGDAEALYRTFATTLGYTLVNGQTKAVE